jgi:hypothetical protein
MSKTYWLSSPETSDLYERLVFNVFDFLSADYNFKALKTEKDGYGCRVTLKNTTTGIQINYEPGSLRIWVLLYRLVNHELPEYQLTPVPSHASGYFYLEDIILAKDPRMGNSDLLAEAGRIGMSTPITEEYLREKLHALADCVNRYAQEVLAGDFSIFEEAQKILDARVQQATTH